MAYSIPAPLDVRLMNAVATLLFAGGVLVLLFGSVWWVLRQPFFPIAGIKVDGDLKHGNAVTLRTNVVPQIKGNFFTVDLARVRAAFETVPWVRKAVVRREFPDKLHVTLTEHVPVAHWGGDAESRLINGDGEVFETNVAELDDSLPHLAGPIEHAGQVLSMYRQLEPLFAAYRLSIEKLVMTSRGSWEAELDNGGAIELGRGTGEEVLARTQRFLASVRQVAGHYNRTLDDVEGADLRHKDGYALRLRGVSTVTNNPKKN